MLEVRHLKRIYKIKGGEPVYALNDVSLKFPETGLVFILGKSGSGKSTLLNVMGGLDNVDDGEIIINDKSSKTFSKVEMDSYRNTYLGFIFQEYNILSDFTVRENIALALQLQHKKATDEEINKILEEVDLVGYSKRKPNELSGGQKQRVAIARALVKEPKIIFGDEPTGALDSNTGKQVFETLKKLSKNKLVIIVSHDRDFAEHFGDRVIELKDGKVISDITKTAMKVETPKDGLYLVGDNIIRLNKNRPLKADDLPLINKALANSSSDIYISADSRVNSALCEAAKIDKDGNREEFKDTDPNSIKTNNEEFKPIKSKFSLGHAFKMGSRSLKVKPFRLVMTILLSTIAFSLFGASLAMSFFSVKSAVRSTMTKNDISVVPFSLHGKRNSPALDEEKIDDIVNKTGGKVYVANSFSANINTVENKRDLFHASRYCSKVYISDNFLTDFNFKLEAGKLPENSNECLISLYSYYSYADFGIKTDTESISSENVTYEKIIGTSIESFDNGSSIGSKYFTITGIVDTKLPQKLLDYRNKADNITYSDPNYYQLSSLANGTSNSVHNAIFTVDDDSNKKADIEITNQKLVLESEDKGNLYLTLGHYYDYEDNSYFFNKNKTSIDKGEALISFDVLYQYLFMYTDTSLPAEEGTLRYVVENSNSNFYDISLQYVSENYSNLYAKYKNESTFPTLSDNPTTDEIIDACINFLLSSNVGQNTIDYENIQKLFIEKLKQDLDAITEEISLPNVSGTLPTGEIKDNGLEPRETWTFSLVGIDLTPFYEGSRLNISEVDVKDIIDKLTKNGYSYTSASSSGFFIVGNDTSIMDKFVDLYLAKRGLFSDYNKAPDDAYYLGINETSIANVISIASMLSVLTQVFLYVGIVMAVFSMLLFYNFISVSINNKKREIGILRAVGAKRSDVFKIFYSESFIIALINFLLATIVTFLISYLVNTNLAKQGGFDFDVMSPGILVVLALLGLSLVASFIASLLPVTKIANKKPIDAIQNR